MICIVMVAGERGGRRKRERREGRDGNERGVDRNQTDEKKNGKNIYKQRKENVQQKRKRNNMCDPRDLSN